MTNAWMIRAGGRGIHFDTFEKGYVAIGWPQLQDMSDADAEEIRHRYIHHLGNDKPAKTNNAIAMILKFRDQIRAGDYVVTYNPETREYLIGTDEGHYRYDPSLIEELPNVRDVKWLGKVSRDAIPQRSRNSLGSTLTLFSVNDEVLEDLLAALHGDSGSDAAAISPDDDEDGIEELKDEAIERSRELIKDRLVHLSFEDMEVLVATILRAMGFRAKVSPKGPDRGVDVTASPDGLGLTQPRIKAEVKHRTGTTMGAQNIRGFIGALREGDSGLFVSTGGFSKEARYEAERSTFPLTLIDLDDLADLVVMHYENFDLEGRALVPLVRIYWPTD